MPRYDDYDRYDDYYDDEPEIEDTGGHRTSYVVVRKPRSVLSRTHSQTGPNRSVRRTRCQVGDLVRVDTWFSFNTEHHPEEPHVRTGYHKSETLVGLGPSSGALAGFGLWSKSKKGSYSAYHGALSPECRERDSLLRDAEAFYKEECRARSSFNDLEWDHEHWLRVHAELVERTKAWESRTGESLPCPWSQRSMVENLEWWIGSLGHRQAQLVREAEMRAVRLAREGDEVTLGGRLYTKGPIFSKLTMHSNLEYAGGAGDCSVENRFRLLAPEGADYPTLTLSP